MTTAFYVQMEISALTTWWPFNIPSLHIGTSASGCVFVFKAYLEKEILQWKDWEEVFKKKHVCICDEYGTRYSTKEFVDFVESKKGGKLYDGEDAYQTIDGYQFSPSIE